MLHNFNIISYQYFGRVLLSLAFTVESTRLHLTLCLQESHEDNIINSLSTKNWKKWSTSMSKLEDTWLAASPQLFRAIINSGHGHGGGRGGAIMPSSSDWEAWLMIFVPSDSTNLSQYHIATSSRPTNNIQKQYESSGTHRWDKEKFNFRFPMKNSEYCDGRVRCLGLFCYLITLIAMISLETQSVELLERLW